MYSFIVYFFKVNFGFIFYFDDLNFSAHSYAYNDPDLYLKLAREILRHTKEFCNLIHHLHVNELFSGDDLLRWLHKSQMKNVLFKIIPIFKIWFKELLVILIIFKFYVFRWKSFKTKNGWKLKTCQKELKRSWCLDLKNNFHINFYCLVWWVF